MTEAGDLLADGGVLASTPVLEFGAAIAVRRCGGCAVLPWRAMWRAARTAGIAAEPCAPESAHPAWDQVVVHADKSRDRTRDDIAAAWSRCRPGGTLLVVGGNRVGIKTTLKHVAQDLGCEAEIRANRSRARVAAFARGDGPGPATPSGGLVRVGDDSLVAPPGVFSDDGLDPGTACLLAVLADIAPPPRTILDLACGVGPLTVAALRRWPASRALATDADFRAVVAARSNLARLDLAARARVVWWDASEDLAGAAPDLILCNPPCHSGRAHDLEPARRMFALAGRVLAPGGCLAVVANRQLPYEHALTRLVGSPPTVREAGVYKVLMVRRASIRRE